MFLVSRVETPFVTAELDSLLFLVRCVWIFEAGKSDVALLVRRHVLHTVENTSRPKLHRYISKGELYNDVRKSREFKLSSLSIYVDLIGDPGHKRSSISLKTQLRHLW